MKRIQTTLIVLILVASSAVPIGAAATTDQQAETYAGSHVSFETSSNAVVDYAVDGETMLETVAVQSERNAQSQGDVGADVGLSAVTRLGGSGLTLDSNTEVSATVSAESGAEMTAHDNSRGVLVVDSGSESQYVTVNVSGSSAAESESDQRVVVTTENGTEGTFIVVGDGDVAVNDRGNVSANLASESRLVFRSYADERDDDDREQERLIAEGAAAAEVYVMESSEQSGQFATDVVQYSEDTTVEVTEQSEGAVTMTAERSEEQGRIVLATLSEQAVSSTEDLQVTVDGNAAAEASSYSELESAIDGGDASRFLVRQQTNADASADVLVAINHFSTREVTMSQNGDDDSGGEDDGSGADGDDSAGDGDGSDGDGDDSDGSSGFGPGFGMVVAIVALLAATAIAAFRRQ